MSDTDDTTTHKAFGIFNRLFGDQLERVDDWMERARELQEDNIDRTANAIDELADLSKETLNYTQSLSREWLEWNVETFRSVAGLDDDE